jgi:autotransporter translocation and assembly factor TamB
LHAQRQSTNHVVRISPDNSPDRTERRTTDTLTPETNPYGSSSELALGAGIVGSASRPELQLSSDPASYTQDQLTGFLVGGEPGGDATAQTGEAVKGALSLGVSARLGRELTKVLPIKLDALSCELATTATSASCSVGRWLSQRMFLGYRKRLDPLSDENSNELQLQYRLGHKSFELTGGDREHISLDLLWRLRW